MDASVDFDVDHAATDSDLLRSLYARIDALERERDHLKIALETSRRIGAAIGVIMSVLKVRQDAAFAMLRDASQRTNTKLRDVADQVLLTGVIPDPSPRRGRIALSEPSGVPLHSTRRQARVG